MKYELDKLVKCSTIAKNKGVSAGSVWEQLKHYNIETIVIDGVNHYDLDKLPEKIKVAKRKRDEL